MHRGAQPASVASRYWVKMKVSPELSGEWMGTIAWSGRLTPGFAAAIAGSFHMVILPS